MTLVVDASAVADLLLVAEGSGAIEQAVANHQLVAPEHITVEVLSVLRGWDRSGRLPHGAAELAVRSHVQLNITLLPILDHWQGVWALRQNITIYDAAYVTLARVLGVKLLTRDRRLARVATDCAFVP